MVKGDFVNSLKKIDDNFQKHFQTGCDDKTLIYHYTNKLAFSKIITSQKIRISNVSYLDDRLEYDYGIRLWD